MRTNPWMKSVLPLAPALILGLALMLTLGACASRETTSQSAVATASADPSVGVKHDTRPLACSELEPVILHAGKITADGQDDLHRADVDAALALPTWSDQEAQLRRLTGDTSSTITSTRKNNGVLKKLCPPL